MKHLNVLATIAVKDITAARRYYEEVLGFDVEENNEPQIVSYKSGDTHFLVYQSDFAGTNKATAATWIIEDGIMPLVDELKAKGVTFEHYDIPGLTREGDVHIKGDMKTLWFKDPDGNILCLVTAPDAIQD